MHLSLAVDILLFAIVSIIHFTAICLTSLRLYHRHSISRLWWDDFFAAVAGIVDCVAIFDLWLSIKSNELELAVRVKIGFLSLISVEWATRIALALAFARVSERTRHYAITLAIMFFCFFIVIIIQTILFCNNDFPWISTSFLQCNSHGELLAFIVAANLLADFLLVCSPLYALRRLRLPNDQRRLIFACFTASAFMSLACITTTVFQFLPETWKEMRIITPYLEGGVSLIVCNLLVIVTYFYKVCRQQRDVEEVSTHTHSGEMRETDRTSSPTPRPTPSSLGTEELTSVNLTDISVAYSTDPSNEER